MGGGNRPAGAWFRTAVAVSGPKVTTRLTLSSWPRLVRLIEWHDIPLADYAEFNEPGWGKKGEHARRCATRRGTRGLVRTRTGNGGR